MMKRRFYKAVIICTAVLGISQPYLNYHKESTNKTLMASSMYDNDLLTNKKAVKYTKKIDIVKCFKNDENIKLINKTHGVGKDYIPKSLVVPSVRATNSSQCIKMTPEAGKNLETLFKAAENQGIILTAVSGYRSYESQVSVFNNSASRNGTAHTEKFVAVPGTSEHQSGLAMDVLSSDYHELDQGFENTSAYKWLKANSYNYGFVIRYQKGKEAITGYDYEPWHLRYVGKEVATYLTEKGMVLEEFNGEVVSPID